MEALEKGNLQYLYTLKGLTHQVQMLTLHLPSKVKHDIKTKRESGLF